MTALDETREDWRVIHGGRYTRLYTVWMSMRQRCCNPNAQAYPRYGGRGIAVCDEWQDFATFQRWALASGYSDELTIERVDNDGGYEPRNCRWATRSEQAHNTKNTKLTSQAAERIRSEVAAGRTQRDLAREYGVSETLIGYVMKRKAWA